MNGPVDSPHGRRAVSADEVELRAVEGGCVGMSMNIWVGGERAGWLALTPRQASMRLTGRVLPPFEGRGIATAAIALACRIASSTVGVAVIYALVPSDFGAAQRVLEANGFACADLLAEPLRFELDTATAPRKHVSDGH